ncbi:UPF0481 protein At3g47200-like [Cornus florida]|uniref:UPF0481 protein At3g47200-like n=1 Tax=Cornus florida TaxID=4283 RepID=UPI002896E775|nr:UPF0481 protein At3g47200-like [Cornus florida]
MANEESVASLVKSIEEKIGRTDEFDDMMEQFIEQLIPTMAVPEQNENAYTPSIVSIGPLHRGTRLQQMESVKLSYVRSLFDRLETSFDDTLKACAAKVLDIEEFATKYYASARLKEKTEDVGLAEMMLIDGCFIIELLYRNFENLGSENSESENWNIDSILSNPFKCYAVRRDLLLLENQIPLIVVHDLFQLTIGKIQNKSYTRDSLIKWIFKFLGNIMGAENIIDIENDDELSNLERESGHHILCLVRGYYMPPTTPKPEKSIHQERIKYSATELRLAGVELRAGKKKELFNIEFTKAFSWRSCSSLFIKGHLEITPFTVSDSTDCFLRNVIAYELCNPQIPSYFTSFAFFMDLLINTPDDVQLFEEAKIIRNSLGSREEVARLFNGICKNASSSGFHYSKVYKEAMDFCTPWRVSTGRLKHYYFGSPWAGISVMAGIILFVLALLSTIYGMLSYYVGDTLSVPYK